MIALLLGCAGEGPRLLTEVVSAPGDTGEGFGDVSRATNGVRGGGATAGSLDVFTVGPELVLGTGDRPIFDAPGVDLVVFENPFDETSGDGRFMDPAVVEVSADGVDFVAFDHVYDGGPDYLDDPAAWTGFAGIAPVLLNEDSHPLPPLSEGAGGDRFDLADLPAGDPVADDVRRNGAVAVRVTAATAWTDPSTGAPFPADPISNGPDVDGIWAR